MNIRVLPSTSQGAQYLGIIRAEKSQYGSCYVLVNKSFIIETVSAGCLGLLNLSKNVIRKKINLSLLIPEIKDEHKRKLFQGLKGGMVQYSMPQFKQGSNMVDYETQKGGIKSIKQQDDEKFIVTD